MRLGINTGFAVNRFPLPRQWMKVIGKDLNLRYVQLTADLINLSSDKGLIDDIICEINLEKKKNNVIIDSVMTGAFTRVNHFSHPNKSTRKYWLNWFKKLADISKAIGATNVSSHFGILCYEDLRDPDRRAHILKETVWAWKELASYCKDIGLKYLSWEPMSIAREYGETISETARIQKMLEGSDLPIYLCLDIAHGDKTSPENKNHDYKDWIKRFGKVSPLIHVKQVISGKTSHLPFIEEYNSNGDVQPMEFADCINRWGLQDTLVLLELGFREREPADSLVLTHLKDSVEFWRKYL